MLLQVINFMSVNVHVKLQDVHTHHMNLFYRLIELNKCTQDFTHTITRQTHGFQVYFLDYL